MRSVCLLNSSLLTGGAVARVEERATFSSPEGKARTGETAPKFQRQPTLATPLVMHRC